MLGCRDTRSGWRLCGRVSTTAGSTASIAPGAGSRTRSWSAARCSPWRRRRTSTKTLANGRQVHVQIHHLDATSEDQCLDDLEDLELITDRDPGHVRRNRSEVRHDHDSRSWFVRGAPRRGAGHLRGRLRGLQVSGGRGSDVVPDLRAAGRDVGGVGTTDDGQRRALRLVRDSNEEVVRGTMARRGADGAHPARPPTVGRCMSQIHHLDATSEQSVWPISRPGARIAEEIRAVRGPGWRWRAMTTKALRDVPPRELVKAHLITEVHLRWRLRGLQVSGDRGSDVVPDLRPCWSRRRRGRGEALLRPAPASLHTTPTEGPERTATTIRPRWAHEPNKWPRAGSGWGATAGIKSMSGRADR